MCLLYYVTNESYFIFLFHMNHVSNNFLVFFAFVFVIFGKQKAQRRRTRKFKAFETFGVEMLLMAFAIEFSANFCSGVERSKVGEWE